MFCERTVFVLNGHVDENNIFYNFQDFTKIYAGGCNFVGFHGVISVIKKALTVRTTAFVIKPSLYTTKLPKNETGAKDFYTIFSKINTTQKGKKTMERDI